MTDMLSQMLTGSVDVDEAVNKYAKMLNKYVTEEGLPTVRAGSKEALDPDAFTTRFNSVLMYLVPGADTTDVLFMGRTKDGVNLRFTESMEHASKERMDFIESMIIKTLSKRRGK